MNLRTALRRQTLGLVSLTVISTVFFPAWSLVAQAHMDHWVGGHGSNGWPTVAAPWGIRLWSALMVLTVAGWAAGRRTLVGDTLRIQLTTAGVGIAVCVLVALPGALWVSRIGHMGDGLMVMALAWGALPVLCTGIVAVMSAHWLGWQLGTVSGIALGGSVLWLISGSV